MTSIFGLVPAPPGSIPPQRVTISTPAANGTGIADAKLGPAPGGQQWRVERVIVSSTSSSPTSAAVYADDADPASYLDPGTRTGNLDVAEYTWPPLLLPGELLVVRWTGMSLGAIGTAVIQYHVEAV